MFEFLLYFGANLNCAEDTIIQSILKNKEKRWISLLSRIGYPVRQPINIYNGVPNNIILYTTEDNTCPICLISENNIVSSCCHHACEDCITRWYKTSSFCPCCNSPINDIYRILDDIVNV